MAMSILVKTIESRQENGNDAISLPWLNCIVCQ